MALKTTLLLMAFSFLFNFVNVIEGSKSNDEDNREKSHNQSSSGEVVDIVVFVSKKKNKCIVVFVLWRRERQESQSKLL